MKRFPAGRMNEAPSVGLSASLNAAGFKLGRLQTGTPARLAMDTIDFSQMEVQKGDEDPLPFSFMNDRVANAVHHTYQRAISLADSWRVQDNQIVCWQTRTTQETHQIIRDNIHQCVHIQETKKGARNMFPICSFGTHINQVRDTAHLSKPKLPASQTRPRTTSGSSPRATTRTLSTPTAFRAACPKTCRN